MLIGHVNTGRVVFHHFSHSSIKGFVICKSQWNSLCLCPFSFSLVLGSDLRGLFRQNFIRRFPSAMRSCLRQSRDWLPGSGLCNTLQDGKGGFEFVGNPFKITAVGDVDDLKKVLTSEFCSFCFGTSEETWQRLSTANIFAICAVSSWFAFMSKTVP